VYYRAEWSVLFPMYVNNPKKALPVHTGKEDDGPSKLTEVGAVTLQRLVFPSCFSVCQF